jgi:hypothetical protein
VEGCSKRFQNYDLLENTIYKVGHHGSHNATGRRTESMKHDELVLMIPVEKTTQILRKWLANAGVNQTNGYWKRPITAYCGWMMAMLKSVIQLKRAKVRDGL